MVKNETYHDEVSRKNKQKLRNNLKTMPDYCSWFFDAKDDSYEASTLEGYSRDLMIFIDFIISSSPKYIGCDPKDLPIEAFNELNARDINAFKSYLSEYEYNGEVHRDGENSKKRKLAFLKTFYSYYNREGYMTNNPTQYVDMPKIHRKEIITLNQNEIEKVINVIDTGAGLTPRQQKHLKYNIRRDKAILMLLLGTGLRVSEMVGLNLDDVNFDENKVRVIRKGGDFGTVYFSDQVKTALLEYLNGDEKDIGSRLSYKPLKDEKAFFLAKKTHSRLAVRSVEEMVKRYCDTALGKDNKITPHRFRSTYGSNVVAITNDILLAARSMGHSSISTTERYYIAMDEERKKAAALDPLKKRNNNE